MAKTNISCIKIAGYPILPPLITEERKVELNKDRCKAIEIEKRLKQKRTSIDSGVMTGSYIETLKNLDVIPSDLSFASLSDVYTMASDQFKDDGQCPLAALEQNSTDSFLKSALEDSEFRDFFYSTAERIFNDNNVLSSDAYVTNGNVEFDEFNNVHDVQKEICPNSIETKTFISNVPSSANTMDNNIYNDSRGNLNDTDHTNTCSEYSNCKNLSTAEINSESNSHPLLVRRNSYTLESPSPVLLEHMAKENRDNGIWHKLSDGKDEDQSLDFKTFSAVKKCRKTWNKDVPDNIFTSERISVHVSELENNHIAGNEKNCMERSKTFVKDREGNYSLPSSSCSSPVMRTHFTGSTDCIQSVSESLSKVYKNSSDDLVNRNTLKSLSSDSVNGDSAQESSFRTLSNPCINSVEKEFPNFIQSEVGIALLNNNAEHSQSSFNTETIYFQPRNSSNLITIQSIPNFNKYPHHHGAQFGEVDESFSDCSSFSLSKYLPNIDNYSRKPVNETEELSTLLSELSIRHKRQLNELLQLQHREKIMLSNMHSENGSISSRSSVNMCLSELPLDRSSTQGQQDGDEIALDKISPCIRELFPSQNVFNESSTDNRPKISDKEKEAAVKITAYARGYLTRRLLKTEKVKQLIEVIKESLCCAFSLQKETTLKKTDFELHERLAHQLTSAFYDLQKIICAPPAIRMGIIAADREKLRKPPSRPSSAISSATRKSLLRRQQSANGSAKKPQETRTRARSLCLSRH